MSKTSLVTIRRQAGRGTLFQDAQGRDRLVVIVNTNLGHAWASGKSSGTTQRLVRPNSLNLPAYLVKFFIE